VRNTVIQSITSKQARTRNTASTVQPKLGIVISLVNNQQHPEVKKAVTNQDSAPPHTTKFSMVYQFTMQPCVLRMTCCNDGLMGDHLAILGGLLQAPLNPLKTDVSRGPPALSGRPGPLGPNRNSTTGQ